MQQEQPPRERLPPVQTQPLPLERRRRRRVDLQRRREPWRPKKSWVTAVQVVQAVRERRRFGSIKFAGLLAVLAVALPLWPQTNNAVPIPLKGVGIDEQVGKSVDLSLEFTNEKGYQQPLSDFFKQGRPVLLNLVYYNCPMLCNLLLNGQVEALKKVPWTPGEKYEVVTISINPEETFNLAQDKKRAYLAGFDNRAASRLIGISWRTTRAIRRNSRTKWGFIIGGTREFRISLIPRRLCSCRRRERFAAISMASNSSRWICGWPLPKRAKTSFRSASIACCYFVITTIPRRTHTLLSQ
jgi:hypothetical protein